MDIKSGLNILANCHVQLWSAYNEDGSRYRDKRGRFARRLKAERWIHNTVTPLGDAHVADQMSDKGETAMGWMAIGTGTPSATALGTELDRNALTSKTQGTGGDDNDVIYVGTWVAGDGTGAITEAGIFNAAAVGTMFVSASFSVINKAAADSLVITWTVTFGAT
jgi:hypothetical protein